MPHRSCRCFPYRPRPMVCALASATCVILAAIAAPAGAQSTPYNPYADSQDLQPTVLADGTLHWGAFYKSAALQKTYERLWNLGACRGTNKAITLPVERNKIVIDNLPEESFTGRARATAGNLAGGMLAFTEGGSVDSAAAVLVAQLHPAGGTHMQVGGPTTLAALRPGMTVRLRAQVDDRGRATEPARVVDIVTPPPGFVPDTVETGRPGMIVGTVLQARATVLQLSVAAGAIRRVTVPLAVDTRFTIVDAAQLELVAPGDEVEITGRRWSGAGAMGAATVFASRIVVHKVTPSARPSTMDVGVAPLESAPPNPVQ